MLVLLPRNMYTLGLFGWSTVVTSGPSMYVAVPTQANSLIFAIRTSVPGGQLSSSIVVIPQ